jgi:hypothetical protein
VRLRARDEENVLALALALAGLTIVSKFGGVTLAFYG